MKINAIDTNGILKQYDVILTYHNDEFNKDYVVYTDNNYNSNNELQIYISKYNPQSLETIAETIEDSNEYNTIKSEVNKVLLTMKNETDKIENLNDDTTK